MQDRGLILNIIASVLIGFKTGFLEISAHKLRSFLSMLGVLCGVAAMVSMLTLLSGVRGFVDNMLGKWIGNVWIWAIESDELPEGEAQKFSRSPGLKFSDGRYLEENVPEVEKVFKGIESHGKLKSLENARWVNLKGVNIDAFNYDTDNFPVVSGRAFDSSEYSKGKQVCIISNYLAEQLQRSRYLSKTDTMTVGSYITFEKLRLKVIGICGPKDPNSTMGDWQMRRRIFIPLLTMQKNISGFNPDPGSLMIKVKDSDKLEEQIAVVVRSLIARHRGVEDFEYTKSEGLTNAISMINNISLLMGIIAGISILVGGLGIMNVMLSSINERIREIGVRKALGAGPLQIFVQFLTETTTLSMVGGILGVCLGMPTLLFSEQIRKASGIMPQLTLGNLMGIAITIISIGVIFGMYPAVKASRLNPIDALRYE